MMNQAKQNEDITLGVKLPRNISIGVVAALLGQIVYAIWAISSIKHSIDESFNQINRLEQSINKISSDMLGRTEATLRMNSTDEKARELNAAIKEMDKRLRELERNK